MPIVAHSIVGLEPRRLNPGTWLAWKVTTDASAVGGFSRYPVGFTYAEVVRFLYGLKTVRIVATAVGTVQPAPFTTPFNLSYDQVLNAGARNFSGSALVTGFTSEANLVIYSAGSAAYLAFSQVFNGAFNLMWTHDWHAYGNSTIPDSPPDTVNGGRSLTGLIFNGLYYPSILTSIGVAEMGMTAGIGMYPLPIGKTIGIGAASGGQTSALLDGTFLGKPIKYHCFSATEPPFVLSSSSFSVTADSYWPYDPGDGGGPIYNTTTGAQLRIPFPPL